MPKDKTTERQVREMYRRYYDLPIRIHTSGGRFFFQRWRSSYIGSSLPETMKELQRVLEQEGVKPFVEFGAWARISALSCALIRD